MTIVTTSAQVGIEQTQVKEYPAGSARFDWIVVSLSALIIVGASLGGWAYFHGVYQSILDVLQYAVPYGSGLALLGYLIFNQWRNMSKGHIWSRALPRGYLLSLVATVLGFMGGLLDFVWSKLFHLEPGLESSFRLPYLLGSVCLIVVFIGPIRSARARLIEGTTQNWVTLGPVILSVTMILSILTNLTLLAHPIYEPVWGPYGAKTAVHDQSGNSDLYIMNADGTGQTRLTISGDLYTWSSDWSPAGKQIVFSRGKPDTLDSALYIMNVDSSGLRQLTDMPGQEYLPAWSRDGKRIAFVSKTETYQQIFAINADGSDLKQLTSGMAPTYGPAWSPDGTKIVYNSNASGINQLYVINADGSHPTQITSQGMSNFGAAWSPDGRWIAFNRSYDVKTWHIYVIRPDGSDERQLTDNLASEKWPVWSPDGRQIIFISQHDGTFDTYVMNADGSNQHNLTENHALEYLFPRWSPDARQIMVTGYGHSTLANPFQVIDLGIAGILLQSIFLMGAALVLVIAWRLPPGALIVLFTLNGLLMAVFADRYLLTLPVFVAGIVADLLLWWLRPSTERRERLFVFAFCVPVVLYTLYYLALRLTTGAGWTIHLWIGAIFTAGIVGLCASFLCASATNTKSAQEIA